MPERLLAVWNQSAVVLGEETGESAFMDSDADELVLSDVGEDCDAPTTASFGWLLAAVTDDESEADSPRDDSKAWDN
jgi:hypothetical protein